MSDGGGHDGYAVGPPLSSSHTDHTPPPAVTERDLRDGAPRGARQFATWIPDALSVPWLGLEVAAFARHPAVQDALDPRRRWRRRADALPEGWRWLLTLVAVAGAVLTATLLGSEAAYGAPSADATDRWSAVVATVGGMALVARAASWVTARWAGRRPHADDVVIAAVVTLTLHGLVSFGWLVGEPRWTPAVVVPVALAVAVSVVVLVLVAVARDPADGAPPAPADPRRVAATLPDRAQERVRRDIAAALDELERRGLAGAETLARARAAALGDLTDAALRRRR